MFFLTFFFNFIYSLGHMSAAQALAAVATLGPVSPAIAAAYALGYADATAAAAAVARPTIVSQESRRRCVPLRARVTRVTPAPGDQYSIFFKKNACPPPRPAPRRRVASWRTRQLIYRRTLK